MKSNITTEDNLKNGAACGQSAASCWAPVNKPFAYTVEMIAAIRRASKMKVSRNFTDFFSDRIKQAATEQNINKFIERLSSLVDASTGEIYSDIVTDFLSVSTSKVSSDVLFDVLAWIREYPNIIGMLVNVKFEERQKIVDSIEIVPASTQTGKAILRRPFDVGLSFSCTTPLAHGGDTKAGNATLFRRMNVLSDTGDILSLPFYAGNSLRGILRDFLADHFVKAIGMKPRRDKPPVALWFFHCLYAGGALEENSKATKAIQAELGKNGIVNTDGVRRLRDMLPALSLLGTALGNRIVCGRMQVGDLRPVCTEWGNGDIAVGNLFDWQFLTRREDHEDHTEHHGMIATTEVLKPGVELAGGIDFDFHVSDVERSALGTGLALLQKKGRIGAESRRDFGGVEIEINNLPSPDLYEDFLKEKKDTILGYLGEIGAIDHDTTPTPTPGSLF